MKKLILSAALVLGSLTAFAQATPSKTAKPTTETTKVATETTKPAETTKQSYTEVTLEEVPETIKAALIKVYPTATLDKAYVNEAKEYKLDVTLNEKKGNLFADEKGNWIKK